MNPVTPTPASTKEGGAATRTSSVAPVMERSLLFTPSRIATITRITFILLALLAFAYLARAVVLPVLLACFMATMLKSPVGWLRQCHLPLPLAAALVVSLFVAGLVLGAIYLGRPAVEWIASAPENFPRVKTKFQHVLRPAAQLTEAASSVGDLATQDPEKKVQPLEVKENKAASRMFTWTGSLLAGATETVALLFLLLASGDLFLQKLVRAMPRLRDKKQAVEISREIQQSISRYLLSVTLINVGLGAAVALALYVIGMPGPLMWGGVAAFANFIPYIGPVLGMLAIGLAGVLAFDSLGYGILPVAAYSFLHLIESYAVTPFILGRRFALNPVLIFVALIFCTWLWGIIGALLAFPILMTVKIICDHVPALNFIGDFLAPHEGSVPTQETKGEHISQAAEPAPIPFMPPIP